MVEGVSNIQDALDLIARTSGSQKWWRTAIIPTRDKGRGNWKFKVTFSKFDASLTHETLTKNTREMQFNNCCFTNLLSYPFIPIGLHAY